MGTAQTGSHQLYNSITQEILEVIVKMMGSSATWQSQDPTLSIGSQDDFEHFLDMGMSGPGDSLQFDFQDFNHHSGQGGQSVQHDHRGSLVGKLSNGRHWVEQDTPMHEHIASMAGTSSRTPMDGSPMVQAQSSNDDLADLDAQIQYLQRQKQQQQQRRKMESQQNYYAHHRYIPPTPNSVEMNGSNNIYSSSEPQHTSMFDRYRAQRDQEVCGGLRALDTDIDKLLDSFHTTCISSRHPSRYTLHYTRIHNTWSLF